MEKPQFITEGSFIDAAKRHAEIKAGETKNYEDAEKQVDIKNGQERKETLIPLLFVYRNNDLFQKFIPDMVNELKLSGENVELKAFPKETEEKEIQEWYEKNKNILHDRDLVPDGTVAWAVNSDLAAKDENFSVRKVYKLVLDDLMNKAVQRAIFGTLPDEYERQAFKNESIEKLLEIDQQMFEEIFKRIQKKTDHVIKKIYVIKRKITEHSKYFSRLVLKEDDLLKQNLAYASFLKQWLENIGVDDVYVLNDEDEVPQSIYDESGSFIVIDRHAQKDGTLKKKSLLMPNESLFISAKEKFGELFEAEELLSSIDEIVREKFTKK